MLRNTLKKNTKVIGIVAKWQVLAKWGWLLDNTGTPQYSPIPSFFHLSQASVHLGPVSRKSRYFSGHFRVSQFPLYLINGEDLSRQTSQSVCFLIPWNLVKRSATLNKRLAVWQMAFCARKVFGTSRNGPLVLHLLVNEYIDCLLGHTFSHSISLFLFYFIWNSLSDFCWWLIHALIVLTISVCPSISWCICPSNPLIKSSRLF